MHINQLQPSYILHRWPYRETSFLLECWSYEYGRLPLIARGVRKVKCDWQGLLQPFLPLKLAWRGRGEIMTLTHVELQRYQPSLTGENLYAGFYLNELLIALLQKWDPHPTLYLAYEKTVNALRQLPLQESYLRQFEFQLLREIGYGLLPQVGTHLHNAFAVDKYYYFTLEQGFSLVGLSIADQQAALFPGKHLLAMVQDEWHDPAVLQDAKRLVRLVLTPLLGHRKLYSRQLFMPVVREETE